MTHRWSEARKAGIVRAVAHHTTIGAIEFSSPPHTGRKTWLIKPRGHDYLDLTWGEAEAFVIGLATERKVGQ